MFRASVLSCILSLSALIGTSQAYQTPESFKHLNKIEIQSEYFEVCVFTPTDEDTNVSAILGSAICLISINDKMDDKILVTYDEGLSADPSFSFLKKKKDKYEFFFSLSGTKLFLPGNGNIYVEGHTNNYFNERRKFRLKNDSIIEVRQPFLYVGLKTKNSKTVKLFGDKEQNNIVATLSPESEIEVLLNDGEFYLIRTSFGLVGWWKFDYGIIKEVFYYGD
jgi:hypothetical protein